MIPTARLAWLASGALVLALGVAVERLLELDAVFTGPLIAWNVAVVAVALADLSLVWKVRVEAKRQVAQVLSVGRPNEASLQLQSRMSRSADIEVTDDAAVDVEVRHLPATLRLAPGERASLSYQLVPTRRGSHALGDLWLRILSPLGLWRRQLRVVAPATVRVYPDLQAVRIYEKLVRESRDERFTRATRRRGGESEFERLREYTRDDDARRIDWKATARKGVPITREYELERNQNIVFLLDCGRLMTAETDGVSHLDHALNAMLMLGHVSVRAGDHVGLVAFDSQMRTFLTPSGGPNALKKLVRASFDLFPALVEPDYRTVFTSVKTRLRKRSLLVLFTQVLDEATQAELVPLVRSLSPTHLPLCILFRDESVEALARDPAADETSLHVRGAAAGELLWRDRLVEEMRRAGALVLHVRPEDLTQQLIARYLDVKSRQLL